MDPTFYTRKGGPCWECHWFGYLMAENPHGLCLLPTSNAMATIPKEGCAFWRGEPGASDGGRPEPLEQDSPARIAIDRARRRLERIQDLAEAEVRRSPLPAGFWPQVGSTDGNVVLSGGRRDHPADRATLEAKVARLGVNAAVRAGKL